MPERSVEDRLRAEYFRLLPEMRQVLDELETEVNHCLLPIKRGLLPHEQVVVTSRIKECERAIDALRRRQEFYTFDRGRVPQYSLEHLRDLAGVRVLVFPPSRLSEVNKALRRRFPKWKSDPIRDKRDKQKVLARKYYGHCKAGRRVRGEYQIVPMLLGLFWEVEHGTIYKPSPDLLGVAQSLEMTERASAVAEVLERFEIEFDRMVRESLPAKRRFV